MKNRKVANISQEVENTAPPLANNNINREKKYVNLRPNISAIWPETNPPKNSPPICIVVMVEVIQSLSHTKPHCNEIYKIIIKLS